MQQRLSSEGATVFVATDACRQAGHQLADQQPDLTVCVTCSQEWGRFAGLRDWQEHCPCCFSETHPNGLAEVTITARVQQAPKQHRAASWGSLDFAGGIGRGTTARSGAGVLDCTGPVSPALSTSGADLHAGMAASTDRMCAVRPILMLVEMSFTVEGERSLQAVLPRMEEELRRTPGMLEYRMYQRPERIYLFSTLWEDQLALDRWTTNEFHRTVLIPNFRNWAVEGTLDSWNLAEYRPRVRKCLECGRWTQESTIWSASHSPVCTRCGGRLMTAAADGAVTHRGRA